MEEVFEIADTVTVFRDGRLISTRPRAEATPRERHRRHGRARGRPAPAASAGPARRAGCCPCAGSAAQGVFEGVSFDVHRGEVLGFAGLIGAGRTDVGLALFGIAPATAGTIVLDGKPVTIRSPREAMAHGIAYVSEDRRQLGLSLPMSIAANISLPVLRRYLNRLGLMRTAQERATAEAFRDAPRDPHALGRSRRSPSSRAATSRR